MQQHRFYFSFSKIGITAILAMFCNGHTTEAAADRLSTGLTELPPQVQSLLDRARAANPQRFQFAADHGAQFGATADGRSFYLLWSPPDTAAGQRTWIVSHHGSASWALDEFFLWYDAALSHKHGILAVQWWFPSETPPRDYYTPAELYAAAAVVLKEQETQPGRAMLHGFSRGSANGYYIALFDRQARNNFFGFCVANAGGASVDYPLYLDVTQGKYGAAPLSGTRWATYCGGLDPNPDRDGCPAMRRTTEFLQKYGGSVELTIEDPLQGHGGFHQTSGTPDLTLSAMDTTLLSTNSGQSFTAEYSNPFNDLNVATPNAENTNVDPAVLKLAQGGYLAVTMRAKKLYLFLSAEGRVFLPLRLKTQQDKGIDAAQIFTAGTGFFDPTLVQWPDGRVRMYVTLERNNLPEAVVRLELTSSGFASSIYLSRLIHTTSETTGVALVNLSDTDTRVDFTSYNDDGSLAVIPSSATNPFRTIVPAHNQVTYLPSQLFGVNYRLSSGWMEIISDRPGMAAFFLAFDPQLNAMDGAEVSVRQFTKGLFPETQNAEISLVNPDPRQAAELSLGLLDSSGKESGTPVSKNIPAQGRFTAHVQDLFPGSPGVENNYLSFSSSIPLAALELFGTPGVQLAALNGFDAEGGGRMLWAPHYLAGGGYQSKLIIVNLENTATAVLISWLNDQGLQMGQPVEINLPGMGSSALNNADPFRMPIPPDGLQGYLTVSSSATRICGFVQFGDQQGARFQTALPLLTASRREGWYPQAVNDRTYFTGLAVVNPHRTSALVTTTIFDRNGLQLCKAIETIPPGGRISKLLAQIVPDLPDMAGGYFKTSADLPIYSCAVFGTHSLTSLSALPAQ